MGRAVIDWKKIRHEYETTDIMLKDLAEKYGVNQSTLRNRKKREGWQRDATQAKNATRRDNDKCDATRKSETRREQDKKQPEPFPGQCKAISHKTGERCRHKARPGSDYCHHHTDGWEGQCTATSKQTGERCRRKAEPGKDKCKFHGGKSIGSPGHQNALKHGFFAKLLPDDDETRSLLREIVDKSPLDILWENIMLQYLIIARAQKLMFVKDQEDIIKHLKRERSSINVDEREWEFQYPWDRHANTLKAQSVAVKELANLIRQYEDLIEKYETKGLKIEEHRLRLEKLRAEIDKIQGGGDTADLLDEVLDEEGLTDE